MLRSSWILNECKFSCKIVKKLKNYRFKQDKKEQILSEVCMIKKEPYSTVYLRRDEKKYV